MKGLIEKNTDGIFLVIKHGGIVQESKNAREGFSPIEVTTRSGVTFTKYIKRYRGVEALVKKIEWYDREYDGTPYQGWKLLLDADGTICTLDLPFESRVGTRFMKLAENVDYSQPVEFSAWKDNDGNTAFSVKQGGENVHQKYNKENPGDCPPPVQGFNKKWNFDEQKAFLHQQIINVVIPMVQAVNSNGHHEAAPTDGDAIEGTVETPGTLKQIQSYLKEFADQEKVTVKEAMETWFGTRTWAEVETLDQSVLEATLPKLVDAVAPF